MTPRPAPLDIDVFHCPIEGANLIEASAGTGKTWTLSALYLRCVLELDRRVGEILVVTYTKAATAELRERIRARLAETLLALDGSPPGGDPFVADLLAALAGKGFDGETLKNRLRLALAEFDQASIFTIHSFCQRALGDTPIAGGVPLVLELVPDDAELLQRAVADAWRRHIGGALLSRELAAYLVAHPLTPETVVPLLRRRRAKPLAREIWPAARAAQGDVDRFRADFAALQAHWSGWREEVLALLTGAKGSINGRSYTPESIATCLAEWDDWLAAPATEPAAAGAPPAAKKLALLTSGTLAASVNKGKTPPEHPCFAAADAVFAGWNAIADDLDHAWRALLKRLLDDAESRLAADKRQRRVAGYDDLLRNLHEALHADAERAVQLVDDLRRRFPVALIDEFQDTDPLQWEIFSRVWTPSPQTPLAQGHPVPLAGEGSHDTALFLVGDPKQAIYRFRHADVHTYLSARERCTTKYTLADNQRSSPALIAAVNALFGRNPAAFMRPGLDFHAAGVGAKPRPDWQAPADIGDALRVWLLPRTEDGWTDYGAARLAALAASANEIARLIRLGAASAIRLGGDGLKPADIAVLVRSHAQARMMRAALATVGVDSVELAQESVFRSHEAAELAVVLAAIAEPQDERRLRAALATELVGLDANAIEALADAGNANAADALGGHVERFLHYRELWRGHGFAPMWWTLFARERVVPRLLALADGERRLTNLLHLGELLQSQPLAAGEAFLRWFAEQRSATGDQEDAALRLESDRDLVQIVTVHKSKGLEYPVVFCPLLWTGGGRDPALIAGKEYRDDATSIVDFRADEAVEQLARAAAKRERAEEELRLIYVALTRAVHRCYLVGGVYAKSHFGKPSTKEARKRILNWLVAGAPKEVPLGDAPQEVPLGDTGTAAEDWLDKDPSLSETDIEDHWRALGSRDVVVEELPRGAPQPIVLPRPAPADLTARPWHRQVGLAWRIGSFSGLMRHGGAAPLEEAAADRDERLALAENLAVSTTADAPAEETADAAAAGPADDDILRFPRGATAGECLHAIFEHADFTRPATWTAAIKAALRRFPLAAADADARLGAMAATMLGDVTTTELVDGVRLADVPPERRLTELAFSFPAEVRTDQLAPMLTELGYPMPAVDGGAPLVGYLSGFIDLVFEADGRFYVLDWKSNHLGDRPEHYGPRGVGTAMAAHGYHLQALVYTVAVHRYLAQRIADYDYERHFGGILYLFIRGVRPGWRDANGKPCGVYAHRPALDTVEAIDGMLTRK